jgi:hypothetical protein
MPEADTHWKPLYTIGAVAALVQLAAILTYAVAVATLGPKPARAEEFFAVQQSSRLASVVRT